MPAYVILEVTVTDPTGYAEYRKLSGSSLAAYGGKFIVRGGAYETLEGDWNPGRLVIAEFESVAQAKRWYDSPEYATARKIRERTANTKLLIVEGV